MTGAPVATARTGVVVLSVFAFVWALAGISGLAERPTWWTWAAMAASLVVTVALIRAAGKPGPDGPDGASPPGRAFATVVIVEAVTIAAAVAVLVALDAPAFVPGAVALVVGVHFFALAKVFALPLYHLTGGWLCLVAVVALGVAAVDAPAGQAVAGIGSAAGLWATAWVIGGGPARHR